MCYWAGLEVVSRIIISLGSGGRKLLFLPRRTFWGRIDGLYKALAGDGQYLAQTKVECRYRLGCVVYSSIFALVLHLGEIDGE